MVNTPQQRLPPWFKVRLPGGPGYLNVQRLLRDQKLHTVCEEAHCPNIGECFESGTATFLILGDTCTRRCGFCAVGSGHPLPLDPREPESVAQSVQTLGLKYVVITSVTRDDLPDGGAGAFAQTIRRIRELSPACRVEVLIPDFQGSAEALSEVMAARPNVLNHNVETVPRLYPRVRPKAVYQRSLEVLSSAKALSPDAPSHPEGTRSGPTLSATKEQALTKSGLMVGLGETRDELRQVMADLRGVGCDLLTIGQYLRPSASHLPVERFYTPDDFAALRDEGLALGFRQVESGPLVRSSYHAARTYGPA